jgi:hypothetical protein
MTAKPDAKPDPKQSPPNQTDETRGAIKRPQQTDATMADKDIPRGSEQETHARK